MRLVVQRVKKASVSVEGRVVGEIKNGLLVLLGIREGDSENNAIFCADKLMKLRVMSDKDDKMNLSVGDVNGEILVVSQFTLYADTSKGNRPSFINAANPSGAEQLYTLFVNHLRKGVVKVETGEFGSYMKINAELDGPVTIIIEK